MGLRGEWVGCPENGIGVQSDFMPKHVRIKNDSGVNLETFPDHPSKRDAGETVTCTVLHGSTANVTVSASEENLFNVALWPSQGVDLIFVVFSLRPFRVLSSVNLVAMILTGDVVRVGSLGFCGVMLGFSAGAKERDELDTVLVQS